MRRRAFGSVLASIPMAGCLGSIGPRSDDTFFYYSEIETGDSECVVPFAANVADGEKIVIKMDGETVKELEPRSRFDRFTGPPMQSGRLVVSPRSMVSVLRESDTMSEQLLLLQITDNCTVREERSDNAGESE